MPKIIVEIDTDTQVVLPRESTKEIISAMKGVNIFFENYDCMSDAFMSCAYNSAIAAAPPVEPLKPIGVKKEILESKVCIAIFSKEASKHLYDYWNEVVGHKATYIYGAPEAPKD